MVNFLKFMIGTVFILLTWQMPAQGEPTPAAPYSSLSEVDEMNENTAQPNGLIKVSQKFLRMMTNNLGPALDLSSYKSSKIRHKLE